MYPHEYEALSRYEDDYWWYVGLRKLVFSMIRKHAIPSTIFLFKDRDGPRKGAIPSIIFSGERLPAPACRLPAGQAGTGRGQAGDSPCGTNPSSSKLLDIGCGTGGMLAFLKKNRGDRFRLYGVDLHPLAIAATRKLCGARELVQGSANELPFPDTSFDAAISLDVFYTHEVDDQKALREAYRVLKPGGTLVLNLPALECLRGEHDLAVHMRHRYTARELREKLKQAGFEVRRLTYWNTFLLPLVFLARHLRSGKSKPGAPTSDLGPLPPLINTVLKSVLWLERIFLGGVDLPLGSSVLAVARKA